ncbi:MAG: alpha/beta fold hydrolase [Flavobacteriales bacterium]|nr:alpha/beta fold hydrolase [Flavobacteriales bacterium]
MNARPHLLLIHGFPLDHSMWQPNLEALESVANVLAPDLLAFGTAEEVPAVLTMEQLAEQLKAQLDAQGIQRTVLCGLSMGGYVALCLSGALAGARSGPHPVQHAQHRRHRGSQTRAGSHGLGCAHQGQRGDRAGHDGYFRSTRVPPFPNWRTPWRP